MVSATIYYYFVDQDLIAQKYAPGGEALWGANGQVFYTGYTYDPVAQSDKQGGAVIAWRGENTSDYGIRAVRFNSQGTNLWTMTDPQVISPTADNASLSILVNLQRCALFFMTGFAENEFTVRFPFLAQQQLNMTTGEAQFSDTGQVLAGGITGWTDGIGIIEMSDVRMAVVWTDSRDNNNIRPAYFQIFDSTGQAQLTENGERLLSVVDTALYSAWDDYVTDGAGGFFCLFHDYQDEWQLRLTRRDATGTQIGGPHGGLVSEDGGWGPSSGFLCSDDSGGCYVAWTDRHIWSQNRKYVMRMNANCQPMWADPLPIIPSDPANNYVNDLIPTSDDGFIVLSGTRITKVLGNAALWTQVITNSSAHVELAADTAGGVFVSWNTNFGQDAKLQHYDAAGAAWGNSIPFNSEGWHTYANSLIPDLLGGVYAVWHRQMNGEVPDEIWAQRVAVNGELLWPDLGIMILDRPDTWVIASVGTGSGNLFVAWEDNDNATVLRGRLIAPDGSIPDVWWQPEEGGLICDSMDTWSHVSVASLGEHDAGLVFTPWSDDEYMGGDLRVQRLNLEIVTGTNTPAVLPLEYVLYQNYPNPFNPVTRIAFELLRASEVELDIFDILGRHVVALVHEPMEAGRHQANFDASELASGIYFYRLKAGDFVQCRKMVVLK